MVAGRRAQTQLDHTHVAATVATGLPLTDTHATVRHSYCLCKLMSC